MPVISWPRVIGVGMSAYFRKYPSTSCTSERHIPHALTEREFHRAECQEPARPQGRGPCHTHACVRLSYRCPFGCRRVKQRLESRPSPRSAFGDEHHLLVD